MNRAFLLLLAFASLTLALVSVVRSQPELEPAEPPSSPPESSFAHRVAAVGLIEASTENITIGSHLSGVVERVDRKSVV